MLAFSLFYYICILFLLFYVFVMKNIFKHLTLSLWIFISLCAFALALESSSELASFESVELSSSSQKASSNIVFTGNILFSWINPAWIWFSSSQLSFRVNWNVGVGLKNPLYKLHVNGKVAATNYMFTWVTSGSIWYTSSQLTFLPNGNIGIGTMNPSYKLHVEWSVIGTNFYLLSDEHFKTDITPLDWSLEKITQLNGYSFTWKDTRKKDIGLIAQEVEKVFPDLVHTDKEWVKAVEYMNIIAPLIESVKSLHQENLALREAYTKLQEQVNALQK